MCRRRNRALKMFCNAELPGWRGALTTQERLLSMLGFRLLQQVLHHFALIEPLLHLFHRKKAINDASWDVVASLVLYFIMHSFLSWEAHYLFQRIFSLLLHNILVIAFPIISQINVISHKGPHRLNRCLRSLRLDMLRQLFSSDCRIKLKKHILNDSFWNEEGIIVLTHLFRDGCGIRGFVFIWTSGSIFTVWGTLTHILFLVNKTVFINQNLYSCIIKNQI